MHRTAFAVLAALLAQGCVTTAPRGDPQSMVAGCREDAASVDLCEPSGALPFHPTRLVDGDLCAAGVDLARQFVATDVYASLVRARGRLPSLGSARVSNKTDEKLDGKALLTYFEKLMLEARCSRVRARDESAEIELRGLIGDTFDESPSRRTRRVQIQGIIADASSGEELWRGEHALEKIETLSEKPAGGETEKDW